MLFKSAFRSPPAAAVTYIWGLQKLLADSRFVTVTIIVAKTAVTAFFYVLSVPAIGADACFGTGKTISTIIISMAKASGFYDHMVSFHFLGDCRTILMDRTGDLLKRKLRIEAGSNSLAVCQCQMFIPHMKPFLPVAAIFRIYKKGISSSYGYM